MRICILAQYYTPIKAAPARRAERFVAMLKGKHQITVLTGMPSYPTGILPKKYRGKLYRHEVSGDIDVHRTYELPTANTGFIKRICNFLSFSISSIIFCGKIGPQDAIIASAPPPTTLLSGYIISRIKRAKLIADIRDFWPRSAVELGYFKENWLIRIIDKITIWLYRKADAVVCVSRGMKKELGRCGTKTSNIHVVHNTTEIDNRCHPVQNACPEFLGDTRNKYARGKISGTGSDTVVSLRATAGARQSHRINADCFVPRNDNKKQSKRPLVSFVGNISKSYDFIALASAANRIKSADFLVVGDGEEKEALKEYIDKNNISNIKLMKSVNAKEARRIINQSDLGVLPLRDTKLTGYTLPAKVFEYMAGAVPVAGFCRGELCDILSTAGFTAPSPDATGLTTAIEEALSNKQAMKNKGQAGRKLLSDGYSYQKAGTELQKVVDKVA